MPGCKNTALLIGQDPKKCMDRPCPLHFMLLLQCPSGWNATQILLSGGTWGAGLSPEIYKVTSPSGQVTGLCSPVKSWSHCLAFLTIVPTAEMTVVLEPLALVVTVTTAGRVAVVVRMVGCAIVVTGMAESHLLFLFWASGDNAQERSQVQDH